MKRRMFIKSGVLSLIGLGTLTGVYAWQIEPFWLEFVTKKMPVKNLSKNLIGKTIMQISDIHVGDRFNYKYLIKSFRKAQKFEPDFVVYTGDYITYDREQQFQQLNEVLKSVVKGKLGTVGILGNHDYGRGWKESKIAERISFQLKNSGIEVLRNQQIEIAGMNFIGFDDLWGTNFDPKKAMDSYDEEKANIVLCHNPDVCDLDIWNNYKGWILSGHTHGGQCKPPFLSPPLLPVKNKKYSAGEINLDDGRILYINRALGHLRQIRFNVRPEITVFELVKK